MNTLPAPHPLVVMILDGWGVRLEREGNAILAAHTPVLDALARHYPTATVAASGLEVGLPQGLMGNSETGHRNIGAGRVEYQTLASIDQAVDDRSFFANEALLGAFAHAQQHGSKVHLLGLLSPGGVHASLGHVFALLEMAAAQSFREQVYLHLFTDGRDTPPRSALTFVRQVEDAIGRFGVGHIASLTGRFYAMDRNENWERTEATHAVLTGGERPEGASSPQQAVERAYAHGLTDDMIQPTAITRGGAPVAEITDGDAVIFFNFRPDRARQLTAAFVDQGRVGFSPKAVSNLYFVAMTPYYPGLSAAVAFQEDVAEYPMGRVISEAGLRQLHVAETEKYAHVTYYLHVGREEPFPGEERALIRSSNTRTFAERPEMEAAALADRLVAEIERGAFDVYFVNFANADMVGHTGDFEAAKQACAVVDTQVGRVVEALLAAGGALLLTSDHGNAETMLDPVTSEVETEHTTSPVPLHYVRTELRRSVGRSDYEWQELATSPVGVLADVAPTVLDILHLEKPSTMTGVSLLGSLR